MIKNKFLQLAEWSQENWLAIVIFAISNMLLFSCLVAFSWLYGYWSNALCGTRFELNSCWQGITAIVTGMGGIAALAKAAWTKYRADSEFNSQFGVKPSHYNETKQAINEAAKERQH